MCEIQALLSSELALSLPVSLLVCQLSKRETSKCIDLICRRTSELSVCIQGVISNKTVNCKVQDSEAEFSRVPLR